MPSYSEVTRLICERHYVEHNRSFDWIASKYGMSKGVVWRWSKQGNWKNKRTDYQGTNQNALMEARHELAKLVNSLKAIGKACATCGGIKVSDRSKIIMEMKRFSDVIKTLKKEDDIKGDAVRVMSSFGDYLIMHCQDKKFINTYSEYLDQWFDIVANQ